MIELNWYQHLNWFIVEIKGRFVVKNLTQVRAALDELEMKQASRVAIDLSETMYLDSSALTILINFKKRISSRNGTLVLIKPNKNIADIFSIVGFEKTIPIVESIEEFKKRYTI
ncbi:MAG TPA: STAS domain-containing protein [Chitinispirillaceae bacterium]|nr:STAS domain-containing protein [Chitinispirillaceae bacterium]